MTAELQHTEQEIPAQWELCTDALGDRSQAEKARILAHLQCMLAEARAMKGADHADA